MVAIRVLPAEVVNRIAAGEVVERPASVVKELLENAIDAGAAEVRIQIEEGGRKRIRVRDDGAGIAREELPLAFLSHATSKLRFDEPSLADGLDLFLMETLGFRGEALASIAAIAEVEMVSRQRGSDCAFRYRPAFGTRSPLGPEPAAAPEGTTVEVLNLFGNTPARRKFLRAAATESSHIAEQVLRVALGFSKLSIVLEHGSRRVLELPQGADLRHRLAAVLGADKSRQLIELPPAAERGGLSLHGFIGPPQVFRGDARGQNFYVNGRWVRDKVLSHALRDAFEGYQIAGRHPVAYLFLEVPRSDVDVNVHPQKTEVRFQDAAAVHDLLFRSVRGALESGAARSGRGLSAPLAEFSGRPAAREPAISAHRQAVEAAAAEFFASPRGQGREAFPPERWARAAPSAPPARAGRMETGLGGAAAPFLPAPAAAGESVTPPRAVQVLSAYIIAECPEGLVLIDQHALHEKVLYERILRGLRSGDLPSQRLLLPEVVRLPPHDAPAMEAIVERLRPFGFELAPFGESEIAIHAVPVILDRAPAAAVVLEAAAACREHPAGAGAAGPVDELLRRIASLMACKQAVKAGTRLDPAEIQALLADSDLAADPRYCPHGRPTSILLRREEIDRRFDRKG